MHNRLLTRLGEQAVLRGTVDCLAAMEYGVSVSYEVGDAKFTSSEYAATVTIASVLTELDPSPGDSLTVGTKSYTIDALAGDNGYLTRCVLV